MASLLVEVLWLGFLLVEVLWMENQPIEVSPTGRFLRESVLFESLLMESLLGEALQLGSLLVEALLPECIPFQKAEALLTVANGVLVAPQNLGRNTHRVRNSSS